MKEKGSSEQQGWLNPKTSSYKQRMVMCQLPCISNCVSLDFSIFLVGYPIEADDLARILLIAQPGPVLIVFVAASRVQLLPLYVDHAKSCPATEFTWLWDPGCRTLQIFDVFFDV